MKEYKPTVVMDFDGVIHSYKSGWQGQEVIPDPAVPGIREVINELRAKEYRVVVVSTRCSTDGGIRAVRAYLAENGIEVDDVCKEKPPAVCYIDDRAICFRGYVGDLVSQVVNFKSWVEAPSSSLENYGKLRLNPLTEEEREELARLLNDRCIKVAEYVPHAIESLRPCRAAYYDKGTKVEVFGVFHRWGSQYEEFEAGPGNYTTALVEAEDGKVYECIADSVQFLDRSLDNKGGVPDEFAR